MQRLGWDGVSRALATIVALAFATPGSVRATPPELAEKTEMRVRLLAPVSTAANKKGDKVTAMVVAPPEWQGASIEGEIRESKSGNKFKGRSTLLFGFHTLFPKEGSPIAITSDVKSFTNSKGQANVDEEGFIIEKKNNLGKVAAASGVGALIGALAGGARGAAIGAGVGAGAALILVQFTAKAPDIRFDPGSEILLSVSPRREKAQQ
ncbi:MAG: hypothetical protein ACP5U2_17490 [Bryobacteraceae bacterium]